MKKIESVKNTNEFKSNLNYFLDKNKEQERLELYKEYSSKNNVTTEEAKDLILKEIFSTHIQSSIKKALQLSLYEERKKDAVELISQLEELKPIFKDYDVNTFTTFISSIEKSLSLSNAEIIFDNNYVSDELVSSLTEHLIKSIANPIIQPKNKEEFISSFNNHPLLYCLQTKTESDKILEYIEDGIIDVGQYKQLITLVLEMKTEKNDEAIDFFISYLIKEDLTKGFYNIHKDSSYTPESIKKLLAKITKGEVLNKYDVNSAIETVDQYRVTVKTDVNGEIIYDNVSSLTLNDSGFWIELDNKKHFFHLHSAQGKGENQNGQQATTINLFQAKEISAASFTFIKKNAGKSNHWKDICYEYGLHLNPQEQILLSNLQFESDALKFLRGSLASENLEKTNFLSTNLRLVKDSVSESKDYNNKHFGMSDSEIIKHKSQLYAKFIEKHFEPLQKIILNTSSEMSVSSQVVAVPILSIIEKLLKMEKRVGILFNQEQTRIFTNLISSKNPTLSNEIGNLKEELSDLLEIKKNRNIDNSNYSKFNSLLSAPPTNYFSKFTKEEKEVPIFEFKPTGKTAEEIKDILFQKHTKEAQRIQLKAIFAKLDKGNLFFNEGSYSNSKEAEQFISYRMRNKSINKYESNKKPTTYYSHLESLNLICEYARIKGRKVYSSYQDYTLGFKPK